MEPIFRVAKQSRIFQDVVDQIQEAIIDGRLKIGDRLPSERELKDTLQTSRSTLREALRVLEQKGLIEIKLGTGGGAVVKAVTADQVTESLDLLIRSQKVSLTHLAEFRESVEGDVVAIAAERAGVRDTERLKAQLNLAEACVAGGSDRIDDFLQIYKKLHLDFAHISKNPIYISILKTIHDNIGRYYGKFLTMKNQEMVENLNDLRDMVEAVEQRQPDRARRSAQTHVRRFNQYMKKHQTAGN
jgi:DNA-binding FadR family transcriptional regulator